MNNEVVSVKDLTKKYRLFRSNFRRLLQVFADLLRIPWQSYEEFVAIDGLNFSVEVGETFAILGQNGSGKSTLLQVIAGVLNPSSGNVVVHGRVAALLELGAGFNPEFTGRENVILNGQLLGLKKAEILARIPQITEFAEIGEFFDRPVKTYSSGMYVRLAFAAAIHTDPAVLIIDEALAVGDARFQRKCYQRLNDMKRNGTTILFVSHDITATKKLADRALVMHHGKPVFLGKPQDAAIAYFDLIFPKSVPKRQTAPGQNYDFEKPNATTFTAFPRETSFGEGYGCMEWVRMEGSDTFPNVHGGEKLKATLKAVWDVDKIAELVAGRKYVSDMIIGLSLSDKQGTYVFGFTTTDKNVKVDVNSGVAFCTFEFDFPYLVDGDYFVNISLALGVQQHHTQIAWYEALIPVRMDTELLNIYGQMYVPYESTVSLMDRDPLTN